MDFRPSATVTAHSHHPMHLITTGTTYTHQFRIRGSHHFSTKVRLSPIFTRSSNFSPFPGSVWQTSDIGKFGTLHSFVAQKVKSEVRFLSFKGVTQCESKSKHMFNKGW